jgi:hypothetical protein
VDRECIEQAEVSGTVKHGKSLAWVVSFFMIVEIFLYSLTINYWFEWGFRSEQGLGIMARGKRKRDKRWMWVVKPGDKIVTSRTAILPSKKLSRRGFSVLEEIVNI